MDFDTAPRPTAESRSFGGAPVAKGRTVSGYAAKFDTRSQNLGSKDAPWFEVIRPGAFPTLETQDCRALLNHNSDLVLARSKFGQGTLELGIDEIGLRYQFEAPDTQAGRDLIESIKRGDIDGASFGFVVKRDLWTVVAGVRIREILEISDLLDISPTTYPAYKTTSATVRSNGITATTPRANGWRKLFEILS